MNAPEHFPLDLVTIADEDYDRSKFLGASNLAAVAGLSPWTSPLFLARSKKGKIVVEATVEEKDKLKLRSLLRGKRWEGAVGEMLVEALERMGYRVEILATNRRYLDNTYPWMAAEIDLEVRLWGNGLDGEIVNVELKTVHPFKIKEWGEELTDEVPMHYHVQALGGLGITGRRLCVFGALIGADELVPYVIERDESLIADIRSKAVEFWQRFVIGDEEPDPLTWGDVIAKYRPPRIDAVTELTDEQFAHVLKLRAVNAKLAGLEAEKESLRFEIACASKGAARLNYNGATVAEWTLKKWASLDFDRLKSEFRDAYASCKTAGTTPSLGLKVGAIESVSTKEIF